MDLQLGLWTVRVRLRAGVSVGVVEAEEKVRVR